MGWRFGRARSHYRRQGYAWGFRLGREWYFLGRWGERPAVALQRGLWWRPAGAIHWVRLDGPSGFWWATRRERCVVLLGYGMGPSLVVAQGNWRRLILAPRRALTVPLPQAGTCWIRRLPEASGRWPTAPRLHGL